MKDTAEGHRCFTDQQDLNFNQTDFASAHYSSQNSYLLTKVNLSIELKTLHCKPHIKNLEKENCS